MTSSLLDHVLAIVAIIAAIYTIYLERSLHGRLMSQQKNIEDLVLTSYEKYLGPFPADMDEATSLISSVQEPKELLIMVDFFGYGHYSRPEKFEKYLKALIEAKSTVQMLVYAEKSAIKALRKQFPEDYFETLKARDSFKDYVKFYKGVLPFRPDTYQEFVNGIVTTQDSLWRDLAKAQRVEVRAVEVDSVDEAVFFWMIPGEEMVFSFSNAYFEQEGYSFKTRNEQFMKTFRKQFNSKWGMATTIVGDHIYPNFKTILTTH